MAEINLKMCPFCGGKKAYPWLGFYESEDKYDEGGAKMVPYFGVSCPDCGSPSQGKTKQEAIEKWNKRTPDVEALEAELAELQEMGIELCETIKRAFNEDKDHKPESLTTIALAHAIALSIASDLEKARNPTD